MDSRRTGERLYTAIVMAFLVGLVVLGLLGVPALLVGAIGIVVAALAIAIFHRPLSGRPRTRRGDRVPAHYVPSVLEPSTARRRRGLHLRRHRHA
ncbi:MAG TPA: hypothetical protein VMH33_10165 [Solirubrobacterales bacterium]|nr:hypothetical protein [Solirubrobacterales bacterium]